MTLKADVIILSFVKDEYTLQLTKNCIDSFLQTSNDFINKIYIVETNSDLNPSLYRNIKVEVIQPNIPFNYNRFFNIGLQKCRADFIISSNNDIVISNNSIKKLFDIFNKTPDLQSLCPKLDPPLSLELRDLMPFYKKDDPNWNNNILPLLPLKDDTLYYGYEMLLHMHGSFYICKRQVFEKIGYLDERFYFYYQDNDYIASLQRLNIQHAIYTGVKINHKLNGTARFASEEFRPTFRNMETQKEIFIKKWAHETPFCEGGFKPFKPYILE